MKTEVYRVDPANFDPSELEEPARVLASGGLVAFPTETVYGIGANAHDPEAVHALRTLKDRPEDQPMSLHIADRDEVHSLVTEISATGRSLMDLYWPGPLTIVFPGHTGSGIGIRLPAHPVARELIRLSSVPVVAPSANHRGEEPAIDAEEVLRVFNGEIPAVVDGGEVPIRQSSTVVRLEGDDFTVLREGLITEDMLRRALRGKLILFVCTGNSCRSPMAEALFKGMLARQLEVPIDELAQKGYRVASAGVAAFGGGTASAHAVKVMADRGLDLSEHRSRGLTRARAEEADLIVALSPSHRWQIEQWSPEIGAKVELINERGVLDPIGGSEENYAECAREIEEALEQIWLKRVVEG